MQHMSDRNKQSLASANERESYCWYDDESEGNGMNECSQNRIYDEDMTDEKHNRYDGNSWQRESKRREFFCESNDSFSDSFSKRNSKNKTDHFFGGYFNGIRSDYRTEYKVNEWLVQSVAENKQSNNGCPGSSQINNEDSQ